MASVVNLHTLNSERLASSLDFGLSSRIVSQYCGWRWRASDEYGIQGGIRSRHYGNHRPPIAAFPRHLAWGMPWLAVLPAPIAERIMGSLGFGGRK